jgi:tetratricopeptide (TPR) repeat protein
MTLLLQDIRLLLLPFLLQAATPVSAEPLPTLAEVQFSQCLDLARKDASSAVTDASLWAQQGGGYLARACHGFALANEFKFDLALPFLIEAATGAEQRKDPRAARFWAQAGNAAIANDWPAEALTALDNAVAGAATTAEKADIEVDRARALVTLNQTDKAVAALGTARQLGPENGTAWLLSATLARRIGNLPDALTYIQTAALLLPRDPAVALEAGNIAIAAGDGTAARKQWEQVIAIAPASRQADTAQAQLSALREPTTAIPDVQSR